MTPTFKNTLIAMATAALGLAGTACGGDAQVESAESESAEPTGGGEASCGGEGSCGASTGDTTLEEPEMDADEGGEIETGDGEASCA